MRDNDKIFRIGGDEFMLIFPGTDREGTDHILRRIKLSIEEYNSKLADDKEEISVSFGTSIYQDEEDCLEATIALADENMYKNKKQKTSN